MRSHHNGPQQVKLSGENMCTVIVDSPKSIPAISVSKLINQDILVQVPGRGIVNCRGGINPDKVNEVLREYLSDYLMYSYQDALPVEFHNFKMTCINKSIVELT